MKIEHKRNHHDSEVEMKNQSLHKALTKREVVRFVLDKGFTNSQVGQEISRRFNLSEGVMSGYQVYASRQEVADIEGIEEFAR